MMMMIKIIIIIMEEWKYPYKIAAIRSGIVKNGRVVNPGREESLSGIRGAGRGNNVFGSNRDIRETRLLHVAHNRLSLSSFSPSLSLSRTRVASRWSFFLKVTKERRWISFCFFFSFLSERHRCLRWRNVFQSLSLEFEESKINGALKRVIYLYITRKYVAFDSRSDNARIWYSGDKIFHPGNKWWGRD